MSDDDWAALGPLFVLAFLLVLALMGCMMPWWAWKRRYAWLNDWADARDKLNAQMRQDREKWLARRKPEGGAK